MLKGVRHKASAILIAAAVLLVVACPVLAGFTVSPVIVEREVSVGRNTLPAITVTNTDKDNPIRVNVEVMGFGQNEAGTTITVKDDTSQYTASSLIEVSPQEFQLGPGETRSIEATATIPPGASGGRYATIVVGQVPEPGMSMVGQVAVAVILTIKDSSLIKAGQITRVDVQQAQPGQPITFITTVLNKGSVHIRPTGQITVSKQGQKVGTADVEPHLILPGYSRQLKTTWSAPEPSAGSYSFEITLNIGDTKPRWEGSFTLSETKGVTKVEGGVGESGTTVVPPQEEGETSSTSRPIDWRLIGEISGGVVILGLLVYFIGIRHRRYQS
jgi:P pilus assembly chaperone PapD